MHSTHRSRWRPHYTCFTLSAEDGHEGMAASWTKLYLPWMIDRSRADSLWPCACIFEAGRSSIFTSHSSDSPQLTAATTSSDEHHDLSTVRLLIIDNGPFAWVVKIGRRRPCLHYHFSSIRRGERTGVQWRDTPSRPSKPTNEIINRHLPATKSNHSILSTISNRRHVPISRKDCGWTNGS